MKSPFLDKKTFNEKVGKYKLYDIKSNKVIEEKYDEQYKDARSDLQRRTLESRRQTELADIEDQKEAMKREQKKEQDKQTIKDATSYWEAKVQADDWIKEDGNKPFLKKYWKGTLIPTFRI